MSIYFSAFALLVACCCLSFTAECAKRNVDSLEPEYRKIEQSGFMYKAAMLLGVPARILIP